MRRNPRKLFAGFSAALVAALWTWAALALVPIGGSTLVPIPSALTFPLIGSNNSGGDQSYGQATTPGFTAYSTAGPGTDAYNDTQIIGRSDFVVALGGTWENWGVGGTRTKSDLVKTVKGLGNYPNVINHSRTPYVTLYFLLESQQNVSSGGGYQTYINLVRANDWWLYDAPGGAGGTGNIVSSSASGTGFYNVDYAYAYATAAGTVPLGSPIVGNAYGTLSNSQGPARTGAQYGANLLLTQDRTLDPRFASLPVNDAAPNADGIHFDNAFSFPNAGGNLSVSSASWDGQNLQSNSVVAAYPSGASSLLADGQAQFFATLQNYLSRANPGKSYGHSINFGSYANTTNYGNVKSATVNAMTGVVQGGMLEAVGGVSGYGWQSYMTAAQILANIDYGLSQLAAPARIAVMFRVPATDGSSTAWFLTGGVGQTVSTGTALEYQEMRCFMALTYLKDAYFTPTNAGYNYALVRWYDEAGDDSLTQVNVPRGWLGLPVGPYVTLSNGVLARQFSGGVVLFNDWANSSKTVTAAMLTSQFGHSYQFIHGTQQPTINSGAAFSSYTLLSGDGLLLQVI